MKFKMVGLMFFVLGPGVGFVQYQPYKKDSFLHN